MTLRIMVINKTMLQTAITSIFVTSIAVTFYISCTEGFNSFIVEGIPAHPQQFPFIVSIQLKISGHNICGGNLIQWEYVLTAAHCVVDPNKDNSHRYNIRKPYNYILMAGDVTISKRRAPSRRIRHLTKFKPHPDYDPVKIVNDIAIICVYPRFLHSPHINLIPLSNTTPATNQQCEIAGWGATADHSVEPSPLTLRTAKVEIKSMNFCQSDKSYHGIIPNFTICAGVEGNGDLNERNVVDACRGDSGGPLKCDKLLCGIVSFGIGCGKAKYPGIYTDVSKFFNWINMTTSSQANLKVNFNLRWCILISLVNFVLDTVVFNSNKN